MGVDQFLENLKSKMYQDNTVWKEGKRETTIVKTNQAITHCVSRSVDRSVGRSVGPNYLLINKKHITTFNVESKLVEVRVDLAVDLVEAYA